MIQDEYKKVISGYLGGRSDIFLYWKGRVALYALLRAMGIKAGDEVLLPAYTCIVAVNPVIYTGAIPLYVDVNPDTYNTDAVSVERRITDRTKVIMCQNTYGLSCEIDEIKYIAQDRGIFTIEDCTHGFGGTFNGIPNGLTCDASLFSTQWNKPFSSGIGGFSIVNKSGLIPLVEETNKELVKPGLMEILSLRMQYLAKRVLLNDFNYWWALKTYRFLSYSNMVTGSSGGKELTSPEMPEDFFKHISGTQIREGLRTIKELDGINKLRKKNAKEYTRCLKSLHKNHVKEEHEANHLFLKYPLLVKDREQFFKLAENRRIRLGDWFISPLHPVLKNLDRWGFEKDRYPNATYLADHVVNLPTDLKNIGSVLDFIIENKDMIVSENED